MNRQFAIATIALFSFIDQTQAAVIITHSGGVDLPNLPGYKSYIITATSTIAGEEIHGVDFAGNGTDNDPATGKGFFGAINQVGPPLINTTFTDNNPLIPLLNPGKSSAEDSQFLIATAAANVAVPSGFAEEGSNILQGIWAWTSPQGQSVPFAQLVIPNGGTVFYRGSFALATPRGIIDSPNISGIIPEPSTLTTLAVATLVSAGLIERRRKRAGMRS